jgi:predicted PurR-regulated permease PerM
MSHSFNHRLIQILLLAIILLLGFMVARELYVFLPGLLGCITLYILTADLFVFLTDEKKWRKGLTALLFIICSLVIIAIPIYLSIKVISPKVNDILNDPAKWLMQVEQFIGNVERLVGRKLVAAEEVKAISAKIISYVPQLINSTANLLLNMVMMFFLYYFLLVNGRAAEIALRKLIPFKNENVNTLAVETKALVKANALGIPVISFVQGVFAAVSYLIFGVEDWGLWGFFTGIFAFFPLVGTMMIWVPIAITEFMLGHTGTAIGLSLFNLVVTGNVDYLTRIVFMKKMVNVHPLITVLGVIAGMGMFGFMGIIFGPLLLSYFVILIKIYLNEFARNPEGI